MMHPRKKLQVKSDRGFTLLETLVAITLLTIAIVAPMELAVQSLASAYYSRDQITASNLAQEGIEAIRSVRDGNILKTAEGTPTNLLGGVPETDGVTPFTVDSHNVPATMAACSTNPCAPLQTNGELYGYSSDPPTGTPSGGWTNTNFTRVVYACYIQANASCSSNQTDEMRLTVTVTWQTGTYKKSSITLYENLYRWVKDGSGSST